MSNRYFLVSYHYVKDGAYGYGSLYFPSSNFPSMRFLLEKASDFASTGTNKVVILSIQELNKQDYQDLVG